MFIEITKGISLGYYFQQEESLHIENLEPMFFSEYGSLFMSNDLPHLLDLCWELEIYGHCILYDQKRYDQKTLRKVNYITLRKLVHT